MMMALNVKSVIGAAMLARSLVACDACLLPLKLDASPLQPHVSRATAAPTDIGLLMWSRSRGGLSNDPGRSRRTAAPVPMAPYSTSPVRS